MNLQLRRGWLARQFAKALDKLFLQLVINIVLFPEENYPSLRNRTVLAVCSCLRRLLVAKEQEGEYLPIIARSRIKSSEFEARRTSARSILTYSRPIIGVNSTCSNLSNVPPYLRGSRCPNKTGGRASSGGTDEPSFPIRNLAIVIRRWKLRTNQPSIGGTLQRFIPCREPDLPDVAVVSGGGVGAAY